MIDTTANPSRPAADPGEHRDGATSHDGGAVRASGDYGPDGLYRHGPQRARPALVWLIGGALAAKDAHKDDGVLAPAPHVARQQTAARKADRLRVLARHARFLAAVRGESVGRNRSRAA